MRFAREREHRRAARSRPADCRAQSPEARPPISISSATRSARGAQGLATTSVFTPRDLPVRCRNVPHQIVEARRDAPETQPRLAGDEALQVVRRNDIEPVIANELSEEFGILLHHHRRHIELALRDQLGLLRQCVWRQLACRGRAGRGPRTAAASDAPCRSLPGRCRSRRHEGRRRHGSCGPPWQAEAIVSGCGSRPSSSKRASAGTGVPSWISANISLQRARSALRRATFSIEPAVATTVSPPRSRFARSARRVAIAWYCPPGSPRQDRCAQVAVVARDAEGPGERRERRRNAQQQQDPQQSLSAPPLGGTLCRLIARHRLPLPADDESDDGSKRERAEQRGT